MQSIKNRSDLKQIEKINKNKKDKNLQILLKNGINSIVYLHLPIRRTLILPTLWKVKMQVISDTQNNY